MPAVLCVRPRRRVSPGPGAHSAAPSRMTSSLPVPSAPAVKCRSARGAGGAGAQGLKVRRDAPGARSESNRRNGRSRAARLVHDGCCARKPKLRPPCRRRRAISAVAQSPVDPAGARGDEDPARPRGAATGAAGTRKIEARDITRYRSRPEYAGDEVRYRDEHQALPGQTRSLTALESPPGSRLPIRITIYVSALANARALGQSPTFG